MEYDLTKDEDLRKISSEIIDTINIVKYECIDKYAKRNNTQMYSKLILYIDGISFISSVSSFLKMIKLNENPKIDKKMKKDYINRILNKMKEDIINIL